MEAPQTAQVFTLSKAVWKLSIWHFTTMPVCWGLLLSGGAIYTSYFTDLIVTNTTFTNNTSTIGGAIRAGFSSLSAHGNIFTHNQAANGSSVYLDSPNEIDITHNCFSENSGTSFYHNNYTMIEATDNWWGATNGPSGSGPGVGDAVGEWVNYDPFLTTIPDYCPPALLIPVNQAIEMFIYEGDIAFTLRAEGGIRPYTFNVTVPPTHGTLSGTAPDLVYTPDEGFAGTDSLTFDATDQAGITATGTITIEVIATEIVVDSFAQEVPFVTNGNCTLGEAIQAANTDTAVDGCAAGVGDDLITLPAGTYTLSQVDNTADNHGPNGLPAITTRIVIASPGAEIMRSTADGTPSFRFFYVPQTGQLDLYNLTLRNGQLDTYFSDPDHAVDYGAAILNAGELNLYHMILTENWAFLDGGAIASSGPLTIQDSTFSDNTARLVGGALELYLGPTQISGSTFTGNQASYGGAIINYGGSYYNSVLTITDSYFSGNTATKGGAIFNDHPNGRITIRDSILLNNVADTGSSLLSYVDTNPPHYGSSSITVEHSCIIDPSPAAVVDQVSFGASFSTINAAGNWWGSVTGPGGSAPGRGTTISGRVVYEPFLTEQILGCDILPLQATDQALYTAFEQPVAITLTAVDGEPPYAYTNLSTPALGTLTGTPPDLIYMPDPQTSGWDSVHV